MDTSPLVYGRLSLGIDGDGKFKRKLPSYMTNPDIEKPVVEIDIDVKLSVNKMKYSWDELCEFTDEDNSTALAQEIDSAICVMVACVEEVLYTNDNKVYSDLVSELEWLFGNVPDEPKYEQLFIDMYAVDSTLESCFEDDSDCSVM